MTDNIGSLKPKKRPRRLLGSRKMLLLWCFLGLAVPTGWLAYRLLGPRPALTVSPETTWATGPLTAEGYVDYRAFLIQQHGTTAAYGDSPMGRLDCGYSLPFNTQETFNAVFIRWSLAEALEGSSDWDWDSVLAHNTLRLGRPFTRFDDSLTASAIAENSRWFEALRLAAASPLHMWQLPDDPEDEPHDPMDDLFDLIAIDHNYAMGHNLRYRIMLSLGERRFADAWDDINLMLKIADRGNHIPEYSFRSQTKDQEMSACECAAIALLEMDHIAKHLVEWIADFPTQTTVEDLRHHFNQNLRILWLHELQLQHRKPRVELKFDGDFERGILTRLAEAGIDWDLWMRSTNQFADAMVQHACPQETYRKQRASIVVWYEKLIEPLRDLNNAKMSPPAYLDSAVTTFHDANELTARHRFVHIVHALAGWKEKHGYFPKTLQQLPVSEFTGSEVLTDPFSGEPFLYQSDGNSIVLYSVGVNLEDDFGWHRLNLPLKYRAEPEDTYETIDIRTNRKPDDFAFRWPSRQSNIISNYLGY